MEKEISAPPGSPVKWNVRARDEQELTRFVDGKTEKVADEGVVVDAKLAFDAWKVAGLCGAKGGRLPFAEVRCQLVES